MRRLALLLMALSVGSALWPCNASSAAEKDEKENAKEKRGAFVGVPIPISEPTVGSGLALVGGYLFHLNQRDEVSPQSMVGLGVAATDNGTVAAAVATRLYLKEYRWRITGGFAAAEVNYDFYGIGNEDGEAGKSLPLEQKGGGGLAEVLRRLRGDLLLGLRLKALDVTTSVRHEDPAPDDGPPDDLPPARELDLRIAGLGLSLLHDRRDDQFYPTKGSELTFRAEFFEDAWGSEIVYQAYLAEYNRYLRLSERQVLALRGSACFTDGDVPFFDLCLFGSMSDLRGYTVGRYRDRAKLAVQAEWRLKFHPRFGVTAFAGVGEVAPGFDELSSDNLLPAAGVGLRIQPTRRATAHIRLDWAVGQDEDAFYVALGEAF